MKLANPKRQMLARCRQFNQITGIAIPSQFEFENDLFERARKLKRVNRAIRECRKCAGLNIVGATESAPGYGSPVAKIFFIGQSLCTQCMATQIPFTEGSGYLIDLALRLSGLTRLDVFMSNVVHCHPQKNRASTKKEIKNCVAFLQTELEIIKPKLIVCLGRDAEKATRQYLTIGDDTGMGETRVINVKHPAYFLHTTDTSGVKKWICDLSTEIDTCK